MQEAEQIHAAELQDLRNQLAEARELLRAIHAGEVDAVVVSGAKGEQVFTLEGADRAYRVLIEAMNEGALILSANGTVLYCNHRVAEILKAQLERIIGRSIDGFLPPDEIDLLKLMQKQGRRQWESRFEADDGSIIPVLMSLSALQLDESQQAWCLIITDLTQRKRSEEILASERLARVEAIEAERQRLFDVLETLPVMVCLLTQDYHVAFANRSFREKFGESRGRHCYEYCFGKIEPCEFCESYKVLETGRPHHWEVTTQDGGVIDAYDFPFTDLNGSSMVLKMDIDITDYRKAEAELIRAKEAAEAAAHAKADFMANMSHEIRTPMNAVIGMTSILLEEPLTPEQKDFVETIRSSGNALLVIINDILDFSRLDREKAELEEQLFDLRAVVEESLDQVALKAAEKDVNVAYIMAKDVPETIYSDPARLRQVLLNLLNNAVKFTEKGEILLSVGQSFAGVRHEIRFSVQDTGIGIPQEQHEAIFKPFVQADASLSREYDGVGLGLAITRKLVELMGGKIGVKSELGKGSCFRFHIMARVLPDEPRKIPTGEQPSLKGKSVLIIEESKTNRMILGRLLHEWGMVSLVVGSTNEARDLGYLTHGRDYDTVMMGAKLADADGIALVRRVKKELPMVLLAPVGTKPTEGFDAVLPLPIKPRQLFNTLVSVFALAPAREAAGGKEQAKGGTLWILLAEDNTSSQKVTLQMLRKLGYRGDLAANGQEAIQALKRQHYDLVLMDVKMPVMDGYDATREIRRLWPENGPKIIALTAYALAGDREKCIEAGMDGYIAKPVVLEDLKRILREMVTN